MTCDDRAMNRLASVVALASLSAACARTLVDSPASRTARYLASIRGQPSLQAPFLREMPKGGELHSHLAGAVYAENYLRWAMEDGFCVRRDTPALAEPPCDAARGDVLAAELSHDVSRQRALIDGWSMRSFDASRGAGHDHFFETFDRFDARPSRLGDMLAEVVSRLARQNTWYIEVMQSLGTSSAMALGRAAGWTSDLTVMDARIPATAVLDRVTSARALVDGEEARMRELLRCGRAGEDPGCRVTVRYVVSVFRTAAREEVFAQTLAAVEVARADPRVVGINLVAPEDDPVSLRDYSEHMRIVDHLTAHGTRVNVSLHAGELTPALVPPEDAGFHIREAVEVAGARRIGHGTDIAFEDGARSTLRAMASRGVAVETCLSSADLILGVRAETHPFPLYRSEGVAQVICTDDEGVSRTDLSREYLRALSYWDLSWADLKELSRNALTYSFLSGEGLWRGTATHRECAGDALGAERPSSPCAALLARSDKAREQWRLEAALRRFEARWSRGVARGEAP